VAPEGTGQLELTDRPAQRRRNAGRPGLL